MNIASEKRWLLGFAIVIIIITSLPYFIGFQNQNDTWIFSGFLFGVEDGNSYIAKMLAGSSGEWLFRTPYTVEPQNGLIAFMPYLILGKLAAGPEVHGQLVVLFQLYRWTGILFLVFSLYQFSELFLHKIDTRRWFIFLALVGGGVGWLHPLGLGFLWQDRLPLEFYSPESFGFLQVFGLPHLLFARALLFYGMTYYIRSRYSTHPRKDVAISGIIWLIMGLFQPLTILIAWLVVGLDFLLRVAKDLLKGENQDNNVMSRNIRNVLIPIIISSPWVIYNGIASKIDPFFLKWTGQNILSSPPITDYLLAYGIVLLPAILGARAVIKKSILNAYFILGWVVFLPLLVYIPYNLQRRFAEGVWIGILILAFIFIESKYNIWKISSRILLICVFPTVIIFIGAVQSVVSPTLPIYRQAGEIEIFSYFSDENFSNKTVLAEYSISNALPAWANVKTIIGHGPESIDLAQNNEIIENIFMNKISSNQIVEYLCRCNVSFIIIGPQQSGFNWKQIEEFSLQFQSGNYQLVTFDQGVCLAN
jgi:hypothetical protein